MKVLFDHPSPFLLAHGGFQIQIEQTNLALQRLGIDVEWLRWWDTSQTGEVIHYFGRASHSYLDFAHAKGLKVVMAELLTGLGSRGAVARFAQRAVIQTLQRSSFFDRMNWRAYQRCDAAVALTEWEAKLMRSVFNAPAERVHVIPNGVEEVFTPGDPKGTRGPWLVCSATITERKRVLELVQSAVAAATPLFVIGAPYAADDPYFRRFREFVATHGDVVRFEGAVSNRARLAEIYREARGFVLLSTMESLSLSALEAAACGCPLLLSDLPWARSVFADQAAYCPASAGRQATATCLRAFYDAAPSRPVPERPESWDQVAARLAKLYTHVTPELTR
ncbi:MAG: D-inositol-3-phosphate glycosyltransferase [Chthoniobacter sp.]|nr:D-inositol-3-phosphate glycosyltransferase [Chthoniobacter sp.]